MTKPKRLTLPQWCTLQELLDQQRQFYGGPLRCARKLKDLGLCRRVAWRTFRITSRGIEVAKGAPL